MTVRASTGPRLSDATSASALLGRLFLPPGYKDPIPAGYFTVHSTSYRILFAFRSIALEGATPADAYAYSNTLKMYRLSEEGPTRFTAGRAYPLHTLPFYDIRALADIHDIVSVEPIQPRDKVMMGMLASLGIEPDKPFNPPPKLKAAMERGVIDAYYYMQSLDTKLHASSLYRPDRHWSFVMVPDAKRGFDFVSDSAVDIDRRAACWLFFTFYPKVPTEQAGTLYLAPIADSNGRPVEAGKTYKLKVLKEWGRLRTARHDCLNAAVTGHSVRRLPFREPDVQVVLCKHAVIP